MRCLLPVAVTVTIMSAAFGVARAQCLWSVSQPLSSARSGTAATTVGDVAMFAGGCDYDFPGYDCSCSKSVDLFDIAAKSWSTAQLSVGRFLLAATTVGSVAIFAGGATGERASLCLGMERNLMLQLYPAIFSAA
jgi:hypothetical protein